MFSGIPGPQKSWSWYVPPAPDTSGTEVEAVKLNFRLPSIVQEILGVWWKGEMDSMTPRVLDLATEELNCQWPAINSDFIYFTQVIHSLATTTCCSQLKTESKILVQTNVQQPTREPGGTVRATTPTWMGGTGWEPIAALQMAWTGRQAKGTTTPINGLKWNSGLFSPAWRQVHVVTPKWVCHWRYLIG